MSTPTPTNPPIQSFFSSGITAGSTGPIQTRLGSPLNFQGPHSLASGLWVLGFVFVILLFLLYPIAFYLPTPSLLLSALALEN